MKLVIFFGLLAVSTAADLNCTTNHFACRDGKKCIPLEWSCDGVSECEDQSDENRCRYSFKIPRGFFVCHESKEALQVQYKCDGEADCADGSDEMFCDKVIDLSMKKMVLPTPKMTDDDCAPPKMRCSTGQCIAGNLICDGIHDCTSGEDEKNCPFLHRNQTDFTLHCADDHFKCTIGPCIPSIMLCDGNADCEDQSDESNCQVGLGLEGIDIDNYKFDFCMAGEFQCQIEPSAYKHKCIPMNETCNGAVDCPLNDDETVGCHECATKGCQQSCMNTPHGAKCICQEGYTLTDDGLTCKKIGFCKAHRCQHHCVSHNSTFSCECEEGYRMGKDGRTCSLTEEMADQGYLFIATGDEIRQTPLNAKSHTGATEGYSTIQRLGHRATARSIAFLNRNQELFIARTVGDNGQIAVSHQGLLRTIRENITGLGYIAVDWVGGNVFFTQGYPSENVGISVCTMHGLFCRRVIRNGDSRKMRANQLRYRGLAVHSTRGRMVFLEARRHAFSVIMANMDGTKMVKLVEYQSGVPGGLAIDYIRSDVYYGNIEMQLIEKVNMDTKARNVMVGSGVSHPFSMVYFDNQLYWSDWSSESVKNISLSHLQLQIEEPMTVRAFRKFPFGISINHSLYQPIPPNDPCTTMVCPWICIVSETSSNSRVLTGQCMCPDGYTTFPNNDCIPMPRLNEEEGAETVMSPTLMREYCDGGKGCQNGGQCRDVKDATGRKVIRIACQCTEDYEGDYCERRNSARAGSGWSFLIIVFCILNFPIAVIVLLLPLYFSSEKFRTFVQKFLDGTRSSLSSSPIAARTKDMKKGITRFLTPRRFRTNSVSGPVISSQITSTGLFFDTLNESEGVESIINPIFADVTGANGSPIAGTTEHTRPYGSRY